MAIGPDERKEAIVAFHDAVNMTAKQIEDWLQTGESRAVGQKESDAAESTGHASGRRIVALLGTKQGSTRTTIWPTCERLPGMSTGT